jgi:hypothetical protein
LNNSFIVVNRLLKANCDVFWLKEGEPAAGPNLGQGAIWVPASPPVRAILQRGATELGVGAVGVAQSPVGQALRLKSVRIGLYEQYGGLTSSGWDRWLFEQYEFPFEVVYPQKLDSGNLESKYDVLIFTDGAFQRGSPDHGDGLFSRQPKPEEIPEQYRPWLGKITVEKTLPQIRKFLDAGGSVIDVGSSTAMAELLGIPVSDYLTQIGTDGKPHPLPREKYYIPGSLLKLHVDPTDPLAYGMTSTVNAFFDNSPVFKLQPDAQLKHTSAVAWFSGSMPLVSGWAWGQQYLDGGTAVVEAEVGRGKVLLLGPEVTFRGQPHATFKLLFNGVYYGSAQSVSLGGAPTIARATLQ